MRRTRARFSGTAQAQESRSSFKVAGTVAAVSVAVGDRVAAGDDLVRLDETGLPPAGRRKQEAQLASARRRRRATPMRTTRVCVPCTRIATRRSTISMPPCRRRVGASR